MVLQQVIALQVELLLQVIAAIWLQVLQPEQRLVILSTAVLLLMKLLVWVKEATRELPQV
jgi:hypothetical protein